VGVRLSEAGTQQTNVHAQDCPIRRRRVHLSSAPE
jgi:hypothetical protein